MFNYIKTVSLVVFTLLAFYSTANAAEGFYFGGGVGYSGFGDEPSGARGFTVRYTDDSDTGFKIFAGYDFIDHFGVELDYARLGKSNYTATKREISGTARGTGTLEDVNAYSLVLVARYPFTDTMDAFIKLGRAKLEGKDKTAISFKLLDVDDDVFTLGMGGRYLFDQFFISAEWRLYHNVDYDFDLFSLGAGYHF